MLLPSRSLLYVSTILQIISSCRAQCEKYSKYSVVVYRLRKTCGGLLLTPNWIISSIECVENQLQGMESWKRVRTALTPYQYRRITQTHELQNHGVVLFNIDTDIKSGPSVDYMPLPLKSEKCPISIYVYFTYQEPFKDTTKLTFMCEKFKVTNCKQNHLCGWYNRTNPVGVCDEGHNGVGLMCGEEPTGMLLDWKHCRENTMLQFANLENYLDLIGKKSGLRAQRDENRGVRVKGNHQLLLVMVIVVLIRTFLHVL